MTSVALKLILLLRPAPEVPLAATTTMSPTLTTFDFTAGAIAKEIAVA